MICVRDLLHSEPIREAMLFGDDAKPIYVRIDTDPPGILRQVDGLEASQIITAAGEPHDVIVIAASNATSEESGV